MPAHLVLDSDNDNKGFMGGRRNHNVHVVRDLNELRHDWDDIDSGEASPGGEVIRTLAGSREMSIRII